MNHKCSVDVNYYDNACLMIDCKNLWLIFMSILIIEFIKLKIVKLTKA